jgi:hypothetical protein
VAEAEGPPSNVPTHISENGILIGRILFQQGQDAPIQVDTAWETVFNPSQAADHGNLAGLTDDDHTQYILHSLADTASDFLVASGNDAFVKKTLAETGAILEADIDHGNIQGLDTGADHSYIDQDVTTTSTPTFGGALIEAAARPEVKILTTGQAAGGRLTQVVGTQRLDITSNLDFNGTEWVVDTTTAGWSLLYLDNDVIQGYVAGAPAESTVTGTVLAAFSIKSSAIDAGISGSTVTAPFGIHHKSTNAPSTQSGRFWHDSASSALKFFSNNAWRTISSW